MRDYAGLKAHLLADLGLSSLDDNADLTSDLSVDMVARKLLSVSFLKKLCPNGNSESADLAALKKFKVINSHLPEGPWFPFPESEAESLFFDYLRDNLRIALQPMDDHVFDTKFIAEHMKPGPGSAQKADSRCFITKLFESELSYTSDDVLCWYRSALSFTGLWADAEWRRFQKFGVARVPGGKTFFAPKNAEISRTCSTEANVNQMIQQAVGAFIEQRLERFFGVSLKSQPDLNRELARTGSIDGSMATIDLASASDCIGLYLIDWLLPEGHLKRVIKGSRSSRTVLPDGSKLELNMVSTMGNGFTFPLQTLIFASAIRSVYQAMGFPCLDPAKDFGVFGDDLVVRRETYDFLSKMLAKLFFQVNLGKSYNTGAFRESCGHDYYAGTNVRGVYVTSLETPQEVCSLINRLHRWSSRHGIRLPTVMRLLLSWTREIRVPPSESDDAGIHVPFELSRIRLSNEYWFKYRYYKRKVKKMTFIEKQVESDPEATCERALGVGFLSGNLRRRDILLKPSGSAEPPETDPYRDPASFWFQMPPLSTSLREPKGARSRYQVSTREIPWWDYIDEYRQYDLTGGLESSTPLTRGSYDAWRSIVADSFGVIR